jgi:hypothetical protein
MPLNKKDQRRKNRSAVRPTFIISTSPEQTSKRISDAQAIQLDIIAHTNFNFFEGRKIAEMLKENRRMWRAVLMPLDLISLRDMGDGRWHADTLYIYPEDGYQFQLEELVREQFNADEIEWIGGSAAVDMLGTTEIANKSQVILSAWWD